MRFFVMGFALALGMVGLGATAPEPSLGPESYARLMNLNISNGPARDGLVDGRLHGSQEGRERGTAEGGKAGRVAGLQRGFEECAEQARKEHFDQGYSAGYLSGFNEFTNGLKPKLDQAFGALIGEREARNQAVAVDYLRGHQKYQDELAAIRPLHLDRFSQAASAPVISNQNPLAPFQLAAPDYRNFKPQRTYGAAIENRIYQERYQEEYRAGVIQEFRRNYFRNFRSAYRASYQEGCSEARAGNYREAYNRGYRNGQSQAVMLPNIESASVEKFELARKAKFNELYPKFADEQYRLGRRDEAEDFVKRPVRLTRVTLTEGFEDGVLQPGEEMQLSIRLRNFSEQPVNGKDIRVLVSSEDPNSAVITRPENLLSRDLRGNSATDVLHVSAIRLTRAQFDRPIRVKINVYFKNRNIGQESLPVKPTSQQENVLSDLTPVRR